MQILTFLLKEDKYAIGIDLIETIENITTIIPIPKSKKTIIGLISSRGNVIPVINTSILLNRSETDNDFKKLIITNINDEKLALAVDDIDDVITIDDSSIEFLKQDETISIVRVNSAILTLLNKNQLDKI